MEFASNFGADLLIFSEGAKTPYTDLLSGMNVLNGNDYNYVLESLYGFCFELGCAAVFNGVDVFGMHFCIFVNPFAEDGETFNKLYIKHASESGSVFELEDYRDCIDEIFQPILFKGTKIGLTMGNDVYLPKLFEKYRLNRVTTILNCCNAITHNYKDALRDISIANNMIIVCAATNAATITPVAEKEIHTLSDDLCIFEFCKNDFAKKSGLLKNDLSAEYIPQGKEELYNLL